MSIWNDLAERINIDVQTLQKQAMTCWIFSELAKTDQEIAKYIQQYGVSSPEDVEEMIKEGKIEGHPAWEDVIEWVNLIDYRRGLLDNIALAGRKEF